MDKVLIAGKKIELQKISEAIKRNLWLGLLAEFDLYQFQLNSQNLLLLVAKAAGKYSPTQYKNIAQRIDIATSMSAVFYFENMRTYERDRLVDRKVYFVVNSKFAFVPTLLANRRLSKTEIPTILLPSSQYLLLCYLQGKITDTIILKEVGDIILYKYPTLAKSAQQLASLGLAKFDFSGRGTKKLQFARNKKELWEKALPHLSSPIKKIGYTNEIICNGLIGGIDALSHYSMLAGEDIPTRVLSIEEGKTFAKDISSIEDLQRIEIWKYPAIASNGYVDKLSLYLSLRDDKDPRVEKELEIMITEMPW